MGVAVGKDDKKDELTPVNVRLDDRELAAAGKLASKLQRKRAVVLRELIVEGLHAHGCAP